MDVCFVRYRFNNEPIQFILKRINGVENFKAKGFKNIVLAGHSSGGWQSIKLKAEPTP